MTRVNFLPHPKQSLRLIFSLNGPDKNFLYVLLALLGYDTASGYVVAPVATSNTTNVDVSAPGRCCLRFKAKLMLLLALVGMIKHYLEGDMLHITGGINTTMKVGVVPLNILLNLGIKTS